MTKNGTKSERPVVVDFKRNVKKETKTAKKKELFGGFQENKQSLILFAMITVTLFVILISMIALQMKAVPVCLIVILEVAMAVCLPKVPVWVHLLIVAAHILVGAWCANLIFMVLCAVVYMAAIVALKVMKE